MRPASARRDPDRDFRLPELRILARQNEVTHHREFAAAAEGIAVHCSDQGLAHPETLISDSPLRNNETPFRDMRGKLPRPIAGRILKAYGNRMDDGKSRREGWQISTTEGAGVKAVHHGRIVFADWLRGFGLLIIVDHGKGYLSLYAHNQSLLKDVGNWVNAGDVIATAGRSGGLSSATLYFEIRHQGRPQDPAVWVKRG